MADIGIYKCKQQISIIFILLKLSEALETVNHKTLLSILRSLGICDTGWQWFASYMDGWS